MQVAQLHFSLINQTLAVFSLAASRAELATDTRQRHIELL